MKHSRAWGYGCAGGLARLVRNAVVAVFGLYAVLVFALNICDFCGHEMPVHASFCSHCGEALGTTGAPESGLPGDPVDRRGEPEGADHRESPSSPASADGLEPQATRAMRFDIEQATRHLENNRPDLAYFFYRNALAFGGWVDALPDGQSATERLLEHMALCRRRIESIQRECPACQGRGRGRMRVESLSGEASFQDAGPGSCRFCGGRGRVAGRRNPSDWRSVMGQAQHRAAQLFHGAGRVPVGNAWIPPEWMERLDLRSEVSIRRATALPCGVCMEGRVEDCRRCRGTGHVRCSREGCRDGWFALPPQAGLAGTAGLLAHRRCPGCNGTAWTACTECRGSGGTSCRHCDGAGHRPVCSRCSGEGLLPCRVCGGSAQSRGSACTRCHAVGLTRCPSCHGDGRAAR